MQIDYSLRSTVDKLTNARRNESGYFKNIIVVDTVYDTSVSLSFSTNKGFVSKGALLCLKAYSAAVLI